MQMRPLRIGYGESESPCKLYSAPNIRPIANSNQIDSRLEVGIAQSGRRNNTPGHSHIRLSVRKRLLAFA